EWGRGDASVSVLFGPPTSQQLHGGAIAFGEARLLAFPVRSLQQLFLWVTCPFIISRLVREITLMGGTISLAAPPVAEGCAVVADQSLSDDIVLEDLSFKATCDGDWGRTATELAKRLLPEGAAYDWVREKFKKHLVLISDDDFSYLVRYATEVTARIVLDDEKKTSENLWYEESLPRDCLFYAWLRCERPRDPKKNSGIGSPADVAQKLEELVRARSFIQIGGNETVGQGWCKLRLVDLPSLS
ncbi:MAG: type III-B CRISPR module RAMP protein Cmr4, partial [Armatimonadetes bacterium]|nr:type III-B CRISPR module RAMP protein Cmr4 [Armatimonadota bacterium]